jgi:hypothetical protein
MTSRRTARRNRYGLLTLGLVLIAGGGLALARGLGAFNQAVPVLGREPAAHPLLSSSETHYAASHGWFWPIVAVAAALAAVTCIGWLLAQLRTEHVSTFRLEPDPIHGRTQVHGSVLTDAIEDEIGDYRGVHRVHADLTDDPAAPELHVTIAAEHDTDLSRLRARIHDEAIAHLRDALELDELPARLTLRLDAAKLTTRTA